MLVTLQQARNRVAKTYPKGGFPYVMARAVLEAMVAAEIPKADVRRGLLYSLEGTLIATLPVKRIPVRTEVMLVYGNGSQEGFRSQREALQRLAELDVPTAQIVLTYDLYHAR